MKFYPMCVMIYISILFGINYKVIELSYVKNNDKVIRVCELASAR